MAKGPESTCSKARILMPSSAPTDLELAVTVTSSLLKRLERLERWNATGSSRRSTSSSRSNRVHLDSSLMVGNKSCFGA